MGNPAFSTQWELDPAVTFLNHGSFGATPRKVLEHQQELRARMERNPVDFFQRQLIPLLNEARQTLASFVNADPDGLVFTRNTTEAINAVIKSIKFRPSDELLVTDHEYNASRNVLDFVARRDGAKVKVVDLPFPFTDPQQITDAILSQVTPLTKLALLDHVTSPTAFILPLEDIVPALHDRGVDTLIDGAHALGMLDLNLEQLAPTYYVSNAHKWMCAPKTSAMLYAAPARRHQIRPTSISHGANARTDLPNRLQLEFDWTGTSDPSSVFCIPACIEFFREIMPGGWAAVRTHNRQHVLHARQQICAAFNTEPPVPDASIGSMATVPIPPGENVPKINTVHGHHDLQVQLKEQFNIEIPVVPWGGPPNRFVRLSMHLYNGMDDVEKLITALKTLG